MTNYLLIEFQKYSVVHSVCFQQMCQIADIEVAVVQGYTKDAQYVPGLNENQILMISINATGTSFSAEDSLHHWIAVVECKLWHG